MPHLSFFLLLSSASSVSSLLLFVLSFSLSLIPTFTLMHTPFAYPPPAPEVCEVVGACESRHTERGSCVPHLKPFAQSMLSASIWICVCVSVCALVFVYVSMTRSGWGECLCQCFTCTKGKALFLYTHMWARPCGTPLCSYSRSLHCGHFFFIWLWSLCVHTKQGLFNIRVPRYLLSTWKLAALRKLPLKEPFVSHLKRNLCIHCITKEF